MKKVIDETKSKNKNEVKEVVKTTAKILKLLYTMMIIGLILIITVICREWKVFSIITQILKVASPLFIGFVIAWLLNPVIELLMKKKISRIVSSVIVYIILIFIIYLLIVSLVPTLTKQLNDLVSAIPTIFEDIRMWLNGIFIKLGNIEGLDIVSIKTNVWNSIENYSLAFTTTIPTKFISIISGLFSGIGIFIVSLLIGFYLLLNFNNFRQQLLGFIPQKKRKSVNLLIEVIDDQLQKFVKGTLFSSFVLFVINTIGFMIVGLEAPLLFGLFCGVTNIIPYIGPYIGGAPAVIVGFTQSPLTGILVLVIIVVTQTIEGNILHPLIMSKTMKLHPVTIIVSLLIFGSFFGIVGMIVATPLVALIKILFKYICSKFKLFGMEEYDLASEIK